MPLDEYIFVWHMHIIWGSSCIWVNIEHFLSKIILLIIALTVYNARFPLTVEWHFISTFDMSLPFSPKSSLKSELLLIAHIYTSILPSSLGMSPQCYTSSSLRYFTGEPWASSGVLSSLPSMIFLKTMYRIPPIIIVELATMTTIAHAGTASPPENTLLMYY